MSPVTPQQPPAGSKRRDKADDVPPWARPIVICSDYIYVLFNWVAAASIVVMLIALFMGHTGITMPWLNTAFELFRFCAVVGILAMLTANYERIGLGWLGVILGVLMTFAGRVVITTLAAAGKVDGSNTYLAQLLDTVPNVGIIVLAMSAIRLVIGYIVTFISERAVRDAKRAKTTIDVAGKNAQRPGLVPQCWQMSRCRPAVRMNCPNFIDRKTCWKRRSGCFCDRNLANYLVGAVERGETDEVMEVQKATASASVAPSGKDVPKLGGIRGHMDNAQRRPWAQQKKLCHACPLFIEHQEYKYRYWHWIHLPITATIVAGCFSLFHLGYVQAAMFLDAFMKRLVELGNMPPNFKPDASTLTDSPFEYVVIGMLALVIGSYVVAFTDKVFLEWKL